MFILHAHSQGPAHNVPSVSDELADTVERLLAPEMSQMFLHKSAATSTRDKRGFKWGRQKHNVKWVLRYYRTFLLENLSVPLWHMRQNYQMLRVCGGYLQSHEPFTSDISTVVFWD